MPKKPDIVIGLYPLGFRVAAGGGFLIERRHSAHLLLCQTMEGTEVVASRGTSISADTFRSLRKEAKSHWETMKDIVKKGEIEP